MVHSYKWDVRQPQNEISKLNVGKVFDMSGYLGRFSIYNDASGNMFMRCNNYFFPVENNPQRSGTYLLEADRPNHHERREREMAYKRRPENRPNSIR